MKLLWLALLCLSANAQVFYQTNFDSGVRPQNWIEWSGSHPETWSCGAPVFGMDPRYTLGAFYKFDAPKGELYARFQFKASCFPRDAFLEVIDLYNISPAIPGWHDEEICNAYLMPDGRLVLALYGSTSGNPSTSAIPSSVWVWVFVHYKAVGTQLTASLAWSLDTNEPVSGPQFCSMKGSEDNPNAGWLLWGPVQGGIEIQYDNLTLSTTPIVN